MIWEAFSTQAQSPELLITFDLPLTEKLSFEESLALISKQGYQRLLLDGRLVRLDEVIASGTPSEIRTDEGVQRAYLGQAA